jgi:sulfopyruvate decarboxylase alpha subunit
MALSLQPKAFTPVLRDVRPEPVAALVGAGDEDGKAIAGDRACVKPVSDAPGDRKVAGGHSEIEGEPVMELGFQFPAQDWRADIYAALKRQRIAQVGYVPDAGHATLIKALHADPQMKVSVLTTEEEGVALLAGADLGGERGVLLMQSSGVGNCVNMFSLLRSCGFPFVTIVTMRGEWAEFNPWQVPMGQSTPQTFERAGFLIYRIEHAADAGAVTEAAVRIAYDSAQPVAVLLSQRLIGAKAF